MPTPCWEQLRVVRDDGLVVDRLPLGQVGDRWYLTFVCTGLDFSAAPGWEHGPTFLDRFRRVVEVSAVDGELQHLGGGGGGSEREQEVRMRQRVTRTHTLRIAYALGGGRPSSRSSTSLARHAADSWRGAARRGGDLGSSGGPSR